MTSSSPVLSPSSPDEVSANMRRRKGLVRRIERCCSVSLKHFPLLFVYGITTWAAYTGVKVCLVWPVGASIAYTSLFLIVLFYCMLNWSYTVAVFTDPGSPLDPPSSTAPFSFSLRRKDSATRGEYSYLPTTEPSRAPHLRPSSPPTHPANPHLSGPALGGDHASIRSLTVKSDGGLRFCKKCQTRKPDRAHHCSTCGRCVLKMDHHCPWLATCVGLKNYKPFLLFCSYVTLFCCTCFFVAASFFGNGMLSNNLQVNGDWFAVNVILLAIMAGIFGLVLAGFTGWHIHLMLKNQTTIEALESTRYLRPIRRTMDRATAAFPARGLSGSGNEEEEGLMHQLAEMHANAVPGVTREEEGEERPPFSRRLEPSPHRGLGVGNATYPHPGTQVAVPPQSAAQAMQSSYARLEAQREVDRYEEYLDEQDTQKMPHAFDRGWRQNALDLFGADWKLWLLPLPSTGGDGWMWSPSAKWLVAQEERRQRREERRQQQQMGGGGGLDAGVYVDGIHDGEHYGVSNGGVPTSIPYAGDNGDDEFRGVDNPLPLSSSFRSRDAETSSVEALFSRDDDDAGGGGGGEEDGDGAGEGEWRWE